MNIFQIQTIKISVFFITSLCVTTFTYAQDLQGCAAKKRNIEIQTQYAMIRMDKKEMDDLERALRGNVENCNDASLRLNREQKVLEKQQKLERVKRELQHEKIHGNPNKILKKQNKLDKAEKELKIAKDKLNT